MESVDPRTMHVLIRDKETLTWQDETWKVAKARRDGNRIVVTYTSGKEYRYGEERARLYDQVERRRVDALDEAASAEPTSKSSGRSAAPTTRAIPATRLRTARLTARSNFIATGTTK